MELYSEAVEGVFSLGGIKKMREKEKPKKIIATK
jgi:hypothetical protein